MSLPQFGGGAGGSLQRATGILFLAFAASASWTLLGGSRSCGCFGAVPVPPAVTFAVDLALAIALLALPATSRATPCDEAATRRWAAGFAPCALLMFAVSTTLAVLGSNGSLARGVTRIASKWDRHSARLLIPGDWLGKTFPLAGEAGLSKEITDGDLTVVLYHRGCPACESVLRSLGAQGTRGVVIEVGVGDATTAGAARPPLPSGWLLRKLDLQQTWLVETPAVIELTDGVVQAVRHNAAEG